MVARVDLGRNPPGRLPLGVESERRVERRRWLLLVVQTSHAVGVRQDARFDQQSISAPGGGPRPSAQTTTTPMLSVDRLVALAERFADRFTDHCRALAQRR